MTKVLVIDDEKPFVRALTISLRARGYEVAAAASGEQASTKRREGIPTSWCSTSASRGSGASTSSEPCGDGRPCR